MRDQSGIKIEWLPNRSGFKLLIAAPDGNVTKLPYYPASRYPALLRALDTARYIVGMGDGKRWARIVLNCLAEPRDDWRIEDMLRRDAEA